MRQTNSTVSPRLQPATRTSPSFGPIVVALAALAIVAFAEPARASVPNYATYLGGSSTEEYQVVTYTADGGTVIAGSTISEDFPATTRLGPLGNGDLFVAKYTATGSLVYSVLFGGSSGDVPVACRAFADGSVAVFGWTSSRDMPTMHAFQSKFGGNQDAFVLRLDPRGAVVFATYLGGSAPDEFQIFEADPAGDVYVAGTTNASNYPVTRRAFVRRFGNRRKPAQFPGTDGVLTKLDPSGRAVYSTFVGGLSNDRVRSIRPLDDGSVVVVGATASTNFPVTDGHPPSVAGADDTFVLRLDAAGAPEWSHVVGGSGNDMPYWSRVDGSGNTVVWGKTSSTDFATHNALQSSIQNRGSYVARFLGDGELAYATYLGGTEPGDTDTMFGVDSTGAAYVASNVIPVLHDDFPLVAAFDNVSGGQSDAGVTKIAADGSCVYSTWVGGTGGDSIFRLFVAPAGDVLLVGATSSPDYPVKNAFQPAMRGIGDFTVMRLDARGAPVYASLFGGSAPIESILDVASDAAGSLYLLGATPSTDFPVTPGSPPKGINEEGYVAKIGPTGHLDFARFLGAGIDNGEGRARVLARTDGGLVVAATARLAESGALHEVDPTASGHGIFDSMVVIYDAAGTDELATYVGGSGDDRLRSVALAPDGSVTLVLFTTSNDLTVSAAPQPAAGGGSDYYLVSLGGA